MCLSGDSLFIYYLIILGFYVGFMDLLKYLEKVQSTYPYQVTKGRVHYPDSSGDERQHG